jgi:hypothetical protein
MGLYPKPDYLHMPYFVFFSTPTHSCSYILSVPHFHLNSNFVYFLGGDPGPPQMSLSSYISNTKFERIIGIVRTYVLQRWKAWRDMMIGGYVWQNIHIATPSKDRHGFSLAWTVTQQGKELLKWCFVQELRSLWKSSSQSATTTKLCVNKFASSPY